MFEKRKGRCYSHQPRKETRPSKENPEGDFDIQHLVLFFSSSFLVACTRLYTSLSVHPSVCPSVITSRFWAFIAKRRADFSYCPCPATILPLPTRTRLMLPCIRPCYVVKNHFLLFSWATLKSYIKKTVHGGPINKSHNLRRKDAAPSPTMSKIQGRQS